MALSQEDYKKIRKELEDCVRPLFFFHDDPDGLCSFLLFYRFIREGKGIPIKNTPKITVDFAQKVKDYGPDKVFILDMALVDQEFIDKAKTTIIWIDHHFPEKRTKVKYFNPRVNNQKDNFPVSYTCYESVKQDLWIAMIGCIGDWFLPPFVKEFTQKYPNLFSDKIKRSEDGLFKTKIGELVMMFSYALKGKTSDVMKCIKILTRIESPYELLNNETPRAKFINKKVDKIKKFYKERLNDALKQVSKEKLMVYTYSDPKYSFTKELANELLYKFPDKTLIIGRIKSGEVKCSIRSTKPILPPIVEKALQGVSGYGGGHEHACGAGIKVEDFNQFIDNFKKELK